MIIERDEKSFMVKGRRIVPGILSSFDLITLDQAGIYTGYFSGVAVNLIPGPFLAQAAPEYKQAFWAMGAIGSSFGSEILEVNDYNNEIFLPIDHRFEVAHYYGSIHGHHDFGRLFHEYWIPFHGREDKEIRGWLRLGEKQSEMICYSGAEPSDTTSLENPRLRGLYFSFTR